MNSTSTPKRLSCRITFMIGHIRIPLSACLALASALSLTVVGHAQDELSDLDEQLQSEFGDDLLEGLDDIPLNPDFGVGDADAPDDNDLRRQLTEGEDIGQPAEDDPTRIARLMRQVQQRIENKEVSADTQRLQQEIVAELDALIEELRHQKKQSSASSSQSSSAGNPQVQQPDQQPDEGQQSPGNQPANNSTERLGQEDAVASDAAALEALVKQVWGHLPDRARQEMQNATVEDFLPKYQQLIEDYYRRLAEEPPR